MDCIAVTEDRVHCSNTGAKSSSAAVTGTVGSVGNAFKDFTTYKVPCFLYSLKL
jgi:hypothetical protein